MSIATLDNCSPLLCWDVLLKSVSLKMALVSTLLIHKPSIILLLYSWFFPQEFQIFFKRNPQLVHCLAPWCCVNVSLTVQIHIWLFQPSRDATRKGSVFGRWLGHGHGIPMDGTSTVTKEDGDRVLALLTPWRHSEKTSSWAGKQSHIQSLNLPASWSWICSFQKCEEKPAVYKPLSL